MNEALNTRKHNLHENFHHAERTVPGTQWMLNIYCGLVQMTALENDNSRSAQATSEIRSRNKATVCLLLIHTISSK